MKIFKDCIIFIFQYMIKYKYNKNILELFSKQMLLKLKLETFFGQK